MGRGLDGESSANEPENDPDHYTNTTAARDCPKHFTSVTKPRKVGRYGRIMSYTVQWSELLGKQKEEKQHQYHLISRSRNDECSGMLNEDYDEWTFGHLNSCVVSDGFVRIGLFGMVVLRQFCFYFSEDDGWDTDHAETYGNMIS